MIQRQIDSVRDFNRFYTRIIGLPDRYILNSNYSLPEVRIMYELHQHGHLAPDGIIDLLHLDKGYLSRILEKFRKKKIIEKKQSEEDGRSVLISLTAYGKKEFDKLNKASNDQVATLLSPLTKEETIRLLDHMREIKKILQQANPRHYERKN
jgi:DNA-binding MarR family transcriptional regulator